MIKVALKVDVKLTLELNEIEARALNAITVYGADAFLEGYYKQLGKSYMEPYEEGLRSLFKTIKGQVPQELVKADDARKILQKVKNEQQQSNNN